MSIFDQRNCANVDPELFFPRSSSAEAARPAQLICHGCPAKAACLQLALDTEQPALRYGIYGGQTAYQRACMVKRRKRGAA